MPGEEPLLVSPSELEGAPHQSSAIEGAPHQSPAIGGDYTLLPPSSPVDYTLLSPSSPGDYMLLPPLSPGDYMLLPPSSPGRILVFFLLYIGMFAIELSCSPCMTYIPNKQRYDLPKLPYHS
ncbi:UNVERIFIED_CONTAM: hypothetical protein FKN15_074933 [Acipenser sinensis]